MVGRCGREVALLLFAARCATSAPFNDAFQLRCWVDLSNAGSGKDQTSGGLLIKVGLLSTLTALSIKSDLRCFYFI